MIGENGMMFNVITKGCEPTKESIYSGCVTLCASEDVEICAGETKHIGLGVKIDLGKLKMRFLDSSSGADFIEDDVEFLLEKYPEEMGLWLSNLGMDTSPFECELYDGEVVDFNTIPNNEFDAGKLEYYRVSFKKYDFDLFMKSHHLHLMLHRSLSKKGLILSNGVGTIDLDCEDELSIIIHNPVAGAFLKPIVSSDGAFLGNEIEVDGNIDDGDGKCIIKKGDKIAEVALIEHKSYFLV